MTRSGALVGARATHSSPLPMMMVVAALTAVTIEVVRTTGPLLEIAFDVSVVAGAGTAMATYLAAAIWGLVLLAVTHRSDSLTALRVGVVALAAARLTVQGLESNARFVVGLATISFAVAVWTLGVAVLAGREGGGRSAASSIAAGAAFAVGLQLTLGTWDAYWRHDPVGWGVTIVVVAGMVGAAVLSHRDHATAPAPLTRRLWLLGPVLGLMWMMTANAGFAASQSDVRPAVAGPVSAVGLLLAAAAVAEGRRLARSPMSARTTAFLVAVAPAVAVAGVFWTSGAAVLVLLVGAQLATFIVLGETLEPAGGQRSGHRPSAAQIASATSLVGLGTILPQLVFQIDYDTPLGFPNELVIVATAALLGAAMLHGGSTDDSADRRVVGGSTLALLAGCGAMVVLGTAAAIGRAVTTDPQSEITSATDELTLMSWNVHYGVDADAAVDLEQFARSIEEQGPSIVTLQEVSRGWVLGGGVDMSTWLAQRLDMHVAYAPAADRQFGNAILTNLPTSNVTVVDLPYGQGPQERSAVALDVETPGGPIRIVSVHLQHKGDHVPTRLDEIDTLLAATADAPALIIGGDFNARPDSPEIDRMTDSGLVSAQDVSGDPTALTDPSDDPVKRIDWVFGRGVTFTETDVLSDVLSSDHLPLVARFTRG